MRRLPLLYRELADWWHVMSDPADYDEEAEIFRAAVEEVAGGAVRTMLELGCGGGNTASHLKARYGMTLVDLSPGMLEESRKLNPECEHVEGDMRTVRLGREFDAVFVHDAIMYMTTEEDLRAAMETAFVHLRPGGVALFVPDETAERFEPRTDHGGHDRGDRSLRYLQWDYDPDPSDTSYVTAFAYLRREGNGPLRSVCEEHEFGLFPRRTWIGTIEEVGFRPRVLPYDGSSFDPPVTGDLFMGIRGA